MRRLFGILVLFSGLFLSSYISSLEGSITGRVIPADAAKAVSAISEKDSVRVDIKDGSFLIPAKDGVYKVVVEANPPYKNSVIQIVNVSEGKATDIGEIKLQRE